jgi:hypothetical protein
MGWLGNAWGGHLFSLAIARLLKSRICFANKFAQQPGYFHSQYSERVLPSASTSYSNSTATLFSRDHFGGIV